VPDADQGFVAGGEPGRGIDPARIPPVEHLRAQDRIPPARARVLHADGVAPHDPVVVEHEADADRGGRHADGVEARRERRPGAHAQRGLVIVEEAPEQRLDEDVADHERRRV